jgi:hypothetical protein
MGSEIAWTRLTKGARKREEMLKGGGGCFE